MKTRAAILWQSNQPLIIDEVEIPPLQRGQVLVKILYSGICRAQYNEIIALKGKDRFLPHLLGHEASAIVIGTGPGVTKVRKNDYVCLSWIKGQGLDAPRTAYKLGSRIINAGAVTTFSDHAVVSENRVIGINKKIPPEVAAIAGCAVVTGCGIIKNTLDAQKSSSLVVFGAGGIGLSVILGARSRGCYPLIAVDVKESKLRFAKSLGATHLINASKPGVLKKISALLPEGADFAVDASGHKSAMENAFACIKDKGTCVIAGNLGKDEKIQIHPFDLIKGKHIIGTWGGESDTDRDIPGYLRSFTSGKLPVDRMITHCFNLDEINKAFDVLVKGEAGRIILRMGN